jgi:hypothetical protein
MQEGSLTALPSKLATLVKQTNTLLSCGKEGKKEPQESRDNDKNRKGKQN